MSLSYRLIMELNSWLIHSLLVFELCAPIFMVSCKPITIKGSSSPFPANFLFGTASSSYQFEGAFLSDGKGLNNWDVFTHDKPGKIMDGTTGDVAVDQYHLYPDDLNFMKHMGVDTYRFSISWARILPKGTFGDVNQAGIHHYNIFIDALLRIGIQPFITLTHYDIPQELEDRYGGWLSPKVQEDFEQYANICFISFGDRVKYWATLNEPNVVAIQGYMSGAFPPSRCSGIFGNCSAGNSETEPFVAAHNMILSHAIAVHLYRTKFQKTQGGSIGIVMNTVWNEPFSNSLEDKLAVERAQSFCINWFLDPIVHGKYPEQMREILGNDLPCFTKHQVDKLKNALDFIGINHYTSFYVKDCMFSPCEGTAASKATGFVSQTSQNKVGNFIGEPTEVDWLYVNPQGLDMIVTYVKERYNNTPMIITENGELIGKVHVQLDDQFCTGYGEKDKPNSTHIEDVLNDVKRVDYMSRYLEALATTIRKGADVRGYLAWSLLDNFEWLYGYTVRFGLYHVDYNANLKRSPKSSAAWYRHFIAKHKAKRLSAMA